ncbi:hypothetical protein GCM10009786_22670 [Leucobacter alluvii]|uniref:(2Fe-2S)-binding protein n=1 Tax=Leucobacter alluvii TaxID=340321 RepID=A0ABN3B7R7_9MICO
MTRRSRRAAARPDPAPEEAAGDVVAAFDGAPISAPRGASIAAALISSGRTSWRSTRDGERRGIFCGIGVCFDCLVEVDGESGQRACMIPLRAGMDVRSATGASTPESGGEAPAGLDAAPPADTRTAGGGHA